MNIAYLHGCLIISEMPVLVHIRETEDCDYILSEAQAFANARPVTQYKFKFKLLSGVQLVCKAMQNLLFPCVPLFVTSPSS